MKRELKFDGVIYPLTGTVKSVGDMADNFTVINTDMESVSLCEMAKGVKIIASCVTLEAPMCAMQAKRLNAEVHVSGKKITSINISADNPYTLARFAFEEDVEHIEFFTDYIKLDFAQKYGVLMGEIRLLSRALFVVDSDNIIRYVEYLSDNADQFNYNEAIVTAKKFL